ncbi:DUF7575 domain-containing protein [Halobaculum litoreum]|uniref:Zinc ribbon domain-containing protein n=1 Tax=Halobaculum litoreum TaxID=3031998 RepID=A0ABD5XRL8_9EURY|nr:zinc ribbon domain-containing protein [Halobaculum sp. DT92]
MSSLRRPLRPWLAAVFGVLVPGTGHLYLRRWRRAAAWILLAFGVSVVATPDAPVESFVGLGAGSVTAAVAIAVVTGVSAVDAFLLARGSTTATDASDSAAGGAGPGTRIVACPSCGRDLEPSLAFCHWCTAEFGDFRVVEGRRE